MNVPWLRPRMRKTAAILAPVVAAVLPLQPAFAAGRLHTREPGFKVVRHAGCGYGFVDPLPPHPGGDKPVRGYLGDIECGAGGAWGQAIYVASWSINGAGDIEPVVERMEASGSWSVVLAPGRNSRLTYLSFAPAGWRGADYLIYTLDPQNTIADFIESFSGTGAFGPYVTGTVLGSAAADPTGDFGGDLYFGVGHCGSLGGEIHREDAAGATSFFASAPPCEMRFGPGGAWGTDLYVAGLTVAPDGTVTPFPSAVPFVEFDWAFGPGLDGDMFTVIPGAAESSLYRIKPDGTTTLFASGEINQVAGCGGSLWFFNPDGCYEIVRTGN